MTAVARRRSQPKDVATHALAVAPELDEEDEVCARVARGELVRLPQGEAPVREDVVAQLRARIAHRPRGAAVPKAEKRRKVVG